MSDDLPPETILLPLPAFVFATCEWLDGFDWVLDDDALFQFVRALKAHRQARGVPVEKVYAEVMAAARKIKGDWPAILLELDTEDGEVSFFRMWERVRFPVGAEPVELACGLAGDGLIRTNKKRAGRYERFLTVAALLQIQVRQRAILLPVRKLAKHFPCEPNTVSAWIGWAREDGVLIRTGEHAYRSAGGSRAAEYVFGLHLWRPMLPKVGGLLGLSVREQDLAWLEERFTDAVGPRG